MLSCSDIQTPEAMILLAATDSQGDRTLQTLVMTGVSSTTTVPNVVGQSQASAATTLGSAGLAVGTVTQVINPAPVDQVLAQAPSAGETILSGEAVALSVSAGPAPTVVPNVVGEFLTLANTQLTNLGFTVAVTPQFSSTVPVNVVMAQAPVAGTVVAPIPANPVALTVSAGPPLAGTVAQIVVEPGPTSRLVGESQQYRATAIFTDNTSADVTLSSIWSSTLGAVASVNATGNALALANGATTLQATLGAMSGQTTLNVVTRSAGDGVPPAAIITAPAAGSTITAPVTVTGTATDANFLRYETVALAGDPVCTILAEGMRRSRMARWATSIRLRCSTTCTRSV
ncbi:MAG: PASTA domain-containing protein [Betaproteobacteria bacterium]|nr:PASTA domain-containing protein [Betaproteobacteria bacterium]